MFVSCSTCGEKLSNDKELKFHIETTHRQEINFLGLYCKACVTTFVTEIDLKDIKKPMNKQGAKRNCLRRIHLKYMRLKSCWKLPKEENCWT